MLSSAGSPHATLLNMPLPEERVVTLKTSTILRSIAFVMILGVVWFVRDVLTLVGVALFLAALMHPAVRWGARHRVPKWLMVLLIYVFLFTALVLIFALFIPVLLQQIQGLSQKIGSSIVIISTNLQKARIFSEQNGLANNFSFGFKSLEDQFSNTASGLFRTLVDVFGGLAEFAAVLVMAFYMVVQEEEAAHIFRNFVPQKYQEFIGNLLLTVEEKIGGWLRGQLFLSFTIAVLYYIALLVLGIDGALALALFAGCTEFIPYLGPMLGGLPVLLVAFSDSPIKALLAFCAVVIIQQCENHILVPKVMQKAIGLNPLISMIAVLIGAKSFGIMGALLAIPLATTASVILTEVYRYRQEQRSDPKIV
jgi:predicted PurR-regulated permease PerM